MNLSPEQRKKWLSKLNKNTQINKEIIIMSPDLSVGFKKVLGFFSIISAVGTLVALYFSHQAINVARAANDSTFTVIKEARLASRADNLRQAKKDDEQRLLISLTTDQANSAIKSALLLENSLKDQKIRFERENQVDLQFVDFETALDTVKKTITIELYIKNFGKPTAYIYEIKTIFGIGKTFNYESRLIESDTLAEYLNEQINRSPFFIDQNIVQKQVLFNKIHDDNLLKEFQDPNLTYFFRGYVLYQNKATLKRNRYDFKLGFTKLPDGGSRYFEIK